MIRVAGTDPGTSSLDVVVLEDGRVVAERRFSPAEIQADPHAAVAFLDQQQPLDLVAGPSGYGLPLRRARDVSPTEFDLMTLVRPDERGRDQGVIGFRQLLRAFTASSLPVVFLPAVVHLPSVPSYRKINRIDLGTPDKLCVAALAMSEYAQRERRSWEQCNLCVIELGSAFTAVLVISAGQLVDGFGGTSGPLGWRSGGSWDGEVAYLLGPLSKQDLFDGGVHAGREFQANSEDRACDAAAMALYLESVAKAVAAAQVIADFDRVFLSGRVLDIEPVRAGLCKSLERFGETHFLEGLPGSTLKHAAQGSAILADGLAGGRFGSLISHLGIREATGTVLDGLRYARSAILRAQFGVEPEP